MLPINSVTAFTFHFVSVSSWRCLSGLIFFLELIKAFEYTVFGTKIRLLIMEIRTRIFHDWIWIRYNTL